MPHLSTWPNSTASDVPCSSPDVDTIVERSIERPTATLGRSQTPTRAVSQNHLHSELCSSDLEGQRFDNHLKTRSSVSSLSTSSFSCYDPMCQPATTNEPPRRIPRSCEKAGNMLDILRWRVLSVYRRLFGLIFFGNMALLAWSVSRMANFSRQDKGRASGLLKDILTAVSANLTVSIAIRNEHVINMLFRIFVVHTSSRLPLRIRRWCAKVYCYGGVHSGCGVAATCWYMAFVGISAFDYIQNGGPWDQRINLILAAVVWLLLVTIIASANPSVRAHMHDHFEVSHRFCGWCVILVFWAQILFTCIIDARQRSIPTSQALVRIPNFWMLLIMTAFVVYPWIRMRRVQVEVETLSGHALRIYFPEHFISPCQTIRISDRPLFETHSFATIPEPEGKPGYSVILSKAGDWTTRIIETKPKSIWIKGVPAWGVLRISTLFNPVVIVATGSGIGPCLGLFNGFPNLRCRVLWSAKSPETTYGKEIMAIVRRADPNARILDTADERYRENRPDMLKETRKLYLDSKAEAVVVISNPKLTKSVVNALERERIAAFGPIWDS